MKILSLNIRGVGRAVKKNYVRDLISREQVDMVCLQETKCSDFSRERCVFFGELTKWIGWKTKQLIKQVG